MLETSRPVESFGLNAGRLCLDFMNTLSDRFLPNPNEVLHTYDDLLIWGQRAHILDDDQASHLRKKAERKPDLATHVLAETRHTRELLFRIFNAVTNEQAVPEEELQQFNILLAQTLPHLCLVPQQAGFTWHWIDETERLELPLWQSIRDAAELLASPELAHVRMCASATCDWFFLDTSKNHSRRWCDMKVCGNRAKARRYYGRQRLVKEK
jgi:predicted RNA-binding Zn ribbon-like protein